MKLFGTDGIRGKASEYPISAEVALGLGRAFATLILKGKKGKAKLVIGRDTRISGTMLEEALIAGINSAGADALPIGVIPSNAVSYFIGLHGCDGGLMISASHNPADENGMKFFSSDGFKISEEMEDKVEEILLSKKFVTATEPGSAFRVRGVKEDYIRFITGSLKGNDLSGLKIAVDAGNGSASYIVKDLFFELKADTTILNNEPDGANINEGGALFPQRLQKLVVKNKLDAGIALDGDADRLVMVDELGNVVDGDSLIAIAALNLKRDNHLKEDTVVVTDYSNVGLDDSLSGFGIKVVRVKTGDKHVSDEIFRKSYSIGGENSGHLIFPEFSRTADALLSAVQLLNAMKEQGKKLSELASVVKKYPQVLVNVAVREKKPVEEIHSVAARIKEGEALLKGRGRVFTRYSGTENKLRILVEGKTEKEIKGIADSIASAVKSEIGA